MRATHLCGTVFEGASLAVREAVADHKERCPAEQEHRVQSNRLARQPGRRFTPVWRR